jgi:ElaB/YqjD/DUF883 family membrane-anchored ribosome-binding protein
MPDSNTTTSGVTDRVSDTFAQTRSKVSDFGSTAADKIDQTMGTAASGLESAADAVHQRADYLPGGPKVASAAHAAADKMSATAGFVREHDVNTMMADVESMVKKNPGPSLLFAAAVGFLVGRSLSRD